MTTFCTLEMKSQKLGALLIQIVFVHGGTCTAELPITVTLQQAKKVIGFQVAVVPQEAKGKLLPRTCFG